MLVQDQSEIVAFLSDVAAYLPLGMSGSVDRVETHISDVFLVGDRAFKLKRAVKFPYLDFSTLALRKAAAKTELRLNLRTAPALYLGLAAVVRVDEGGLALRLGGQDEGVVEWLVVMRRFPQSALLDAMALQGPLTVALMERAAEAVAAFHADAQVARRYGGADGMRHAGDGVRRAFAEIAGVFESAAVSELIGRSDAAVERLAPLLDGRKAAGLVRHGHGDLHLRNIALIDGRPTLFDCIEFSQEIACVDVLYDLAFLLMDLWHRKLPAHANATLNRYLEITRDYEGLVALPLFLASRAAIRAHVTGTIASGTADAADAVIGESLIAEARAYLDLGRALIDPPAPRLIAVGGLPGSGKTTIAKALAPEILPAPGAVVLRSDVIRKSLAGVGPLDRLGPEGYTAEMTERTYAALYTSARTALGAGHSVIADAVNLQPGERARLEDIARASGVAFSGLWLEAPVETLQARVADRSGDASDATAEIVRAVAQQRSGDIGWAKIDAGGCPATVAEKARRAITEKT